MQYFLGFFIASGFVVDVAYGCCVVTEKPALMSDLGEGTFA